MIGRRVGTTGGGVNGGGGSGGATIAASTRVDGSVVAGIGVGGGAGVMLGSFRTEGGTSGRGANSATRVSISRRLRPQALARTASWFSGVRCRLSNRTEVSDSAPEARWSRIAGKLRQARAASIRLQAASSESRSTSVQYLKSDPQPLEAWREGRVS